LSFLNLGLLQEAAGMRRNTESERVNEEEDESRKGKGEEQEEETGRTDCRWVCGIAAPSLFGLLRGAPPSFNFSVSAKSQPEKSFKPFWTKQKYK
jgi:hypothetical protein